MTDVHALSGAYAIDALDDDERAQFERHLDRCDECRAEVSSLQQAGAELAATTPLSPSTELRARVLADIAHVRPLPPRTVVADLAAHRSRRRRPVLLAAAAAAVVATMGIGAAVTQPWADEPTVQSALPDPTAAVLEADDAETHASDLGRVGGSATATVVRSRELGQAVIITQNMPMLPRSEVYQLWLRVGGAMEPAGLMTANDSTLLLEGDASEAEAIGVTVEPAGGSPRPTTQPVAYFPLETA